MRYTTIVDGLRGEVYAPLHDVLDEADYQWAYDQTRHVRVEDELGTVIYENGVWFNYRDPEEKR